MNCSLTHLGPSAIYFPKTPSFPLGVVRKQEQLHLQVSKNRVQPGQVPFRSKQNKLYTVYNELVLATCALAFVHCSVMSPHSAYVVSYLWEGQSHWLQHQLIADE